MAKQPEKWIQKMDMNKGGLHRALHIPEGEKIPPEKIKQALKSEDPHVRKMAQLAKTLKKL